MQKTLRDKPLFQGSVSSRKTFGTKYFHAFLQLKTFIPQIYKISPIHLIEALLHWCEILHLKLLEIFKVFGLFEKCNIIDDDTRRRWLVNAKFVDLKTEKSKYFSVFTIKILQTIRKPKTFIFRDKQPAIHLIKETKQAKRVWTHHTPMSTSHYPEQPKKPRIRGFINRPSETSRL